MIRIFRCEFIKIWRKPLFLFCVLAFLAANLLFLWYNGNSGLIPNSAYQKLSQEMAPLTEKERAEFISAQQERATALFALNQIDLLALEAADMQEYQIEMFRQEVPYMEQYREDYQNGAKPQYTESFEQEKLFWDEVAQDTVTQEDYQQFLADIQKKATNLSGVSIFAKPDGETYEQKSIQQTADQYKKLEHITVIPEQSQGLLRATEAVTTDFILLLLILLLSVLLVFEEKQKGLLQLTRSMPKGRQEAIISKIFVLIFSSAILTLVFWGSNLIYCALTLGLGDLFRSVQSVSFLIGCPYAFLVAGYLGVFVFSKWISYLIFGGSILLLCVLFRRITTVGFAAAAVYGIEAGLYFGLEPLSKYGFLRTFNVFNLIQTNNFYSTYSTVNISNEPFSAIFAVWIALAIVVILLLCFAVISWTVQKNMQTKAPLPRKRQKCLSLLHHTPAASVWKQEIYKLFIVNKAIILIPVFLILIFPSLTQRSVYLSPEELYYQNYMNHLSGELTVEKENYLQEENDRLNTAQAEIERIEHLYREKQITEIQRVQYEQPYQGVLTAKSAFDRVMQYYDHLKEQGGGYFVYDSGYTVLFQGNDMIYLAILLFGALCFSNLFSMELQKGTVKLIRTLPKGRTATVRCKVILSLMVCIVMAGIAYGMEVVSLDKSYGLGQWNAPISCLPGFSLLPSWLPIWGYTIISFVLKLIAVSGSILIVLLISARSKNGFIAILFSVFMLMFPLILYSMNVEYLQYFGFLTLAQAPSLLPMENGWIIVSLYLGLIALTTGFTLQTIKRRFENVM